MERYGLPLTVFSENPENQSAVKVIFTQDPILFAHIESGTVDLIGLQENVNLKLYGYSVTENATISADAQVIIRHGQNVGGIEIFAVKVPASRQSVQFFDGINCPNGIFIDRVSGTTKINLFYKVT